VRTWERGPPSASAEIVLILMNKDVANSLEQLSYLVQDDKDNGKKTIALEYCKPVLTFIRDAVKAAAFAGSGNINQFEMEDYCTFVVSMDKSLAVDRGTAKSNITNLQSQVAALTSAVAESAQTEHDKKLRLRNLSKAIPTQPSQDGTSEKRGRTRLKRGRAKVMA
jgi:hypothetical protein